MSVKVNCDETLGAVSYVEDAGTVTFTATPDDDALFMKWGYFFPQLIVTDEGEKLVTNDGFFFSANVNGETEETRSTFSLQTDNVSAFAYFTSLSIDIEGRGVIQKTKTNNTVKFTAVPDDNCLFRKMIVTNNGVSTEYRRKNVTITVEGDVSVYALFEFTLDWIPTITDRSQADINNKTAKAYLNYTDFNRIEQDTTYLQNYYGFMFTTKTNWTLTDFPKQADFTRILNNLRALRGASGLALEEVPAEPINTFSKVNTIESILQAIYDHIVNQGG